jgi:hypothetical protein
MDLGVRAIICQHSKARSKCVECKQGETGGEELCSHCQPRNCRECRADEVEVRFYLGVCLVYATIVMVVTMFVL